MPDGARRGAAGAGPRASASPGRPRAHLRALLPGRPGPQPRHRRHRARPGHRPPRGHQPRTARYGSSPGWARARPSPSSCPAGGVRPPTTGLTPADDPTDPAAPRARPMSHVGADMSPSTSVLVVEDEDSFIDALTLGLDREGFTVQRGPRRGRGARHVRRRAARPGAARRDAAQGVGHRRVPRAAVAVERADHHGDGQGRRDRHRRRAGGRRRRLRDQALPAARAGRPHAGRAAPALERRCRAQRSPCCSTTWSRWATCGSTTSATRCSSAGDEARLPLKEFELLALLLENAGRVLTRETLIDRVWGADYVGDTKTLDVHIKRLRSKVEPDPATPDPDRHHPRPRLQVREPRAR